MVSVDREAPGWMKEAELARKNEVLETRNRELMRALKSYRSDYAGDIWGARSMGFIVGVFTTMAIACWW